MKKIKVGSDFSGVGAFNQALKRLNVDYHEVFACDMDKYARKTFIHNYGEPDYYPENVYDREIPTDSLDIYMTSPPCQAFSLAGKRLGKDDKRGILFFNSHEFIRVNKPRYFIFENVKGLLSDDGERTFNEWVNMLGGKSVNGNAVMFPYDDAVPYHIYWKVLNAKEHGVPQNRERVFIVGIRDDADNTFWFPAEEFLTKRLKDVLEDDVDEKYFLSEKMLDYFITNTEKQKENGNGFKFYPSDGTTIGKAITCKAGSRMDDEFIQVKSATSKGYEEQLNDSSDIHNCITEAIGRQGSSKEYIEICNRVNKALEKKYNDKRLNKTIENNNLPDGEPMMLDTYNQSVHEYCPSLKARHAQNNDRRLWTGYSIRRLTPRECFRLMDFPDDFDFSVVSDSQAYKQAGNSIVVNVLYKILKNLNL